MRRLFKSRSVEGSLFARISEAVRRRRFAREDATESKPQEASFRLLFEGNPIPMWVYEHGTMRFIAVNDAAIRQYGYTREQFLTMTLLDVRPSEDRDQLRRDAEWPREHYRAGRIGVISRPTAPSSRSASSRRR